MMSTTKAGLLLAAGLSGTAMLCPLCGGGTGIANAATRTAHMQPVDTAQAQLHISGMTCGTCPTTARVALKKLAGVYSATVTLEDSLGVVRYDPRRVTPAQISAHLTRLTGYGATVRPDSTSAPLKP